MEPLFHMLATKVYIPGVKAGVVQRTDVPPRTEHIQPVGMDGKTGNSNKSSWAAAVYPVHGTVT